MLTFFFTYKDPAESAKRNSSTMFASVRILDQISISPHMVYPIQTGMDKFDSLQVKRRPFIITKVFLFLLQL
jgi:hypothetical protein